MLGQKMWELGQKNDTAQDQRRKRWRKKTLLRAVETEFYDAKMREKKVRYRKKVMSIDIWNVLQYQYRYWIWKNTVAVSVSHQDVEVFFSIDIDIFFLKHILFGPLENRN